MRTGVLFLSAAMLMAQSVWSRADEACHPAVDAAQAQFLVGYGSLMQTESRQRTTPRAGPSLPVRIHGFERAWNARGSSFAMTTFLGVLPSAEGRFNAALYRLPDEDAVLATDRRENGYCRSPVTAGQIEMLGLDAPPVGQVWLYAVQPGRALLADREHPVVQSYVDVFLSGCIEIGEEAGLAEFATECVQSTRDWPAYWVNDRLMPRRPFVYQPLAGKIDALLERAVPQALRARVIE